VQRRRVPCRRRHDYRALDQHADPIEFVLPNRE
jgi:hypothetical protein